jgi:hypothetical protein
MKKEQIGFITVDAGLVQVGDPCYTSDGMNHAEDWSKFCDKLFKDQKDGVYLVKHEAGANGKAIIVSTAYGDGLYPVYIKRNKEGSILQLIVDFR